MLECCARIFASVFGKCTHYHQWVKAIMLKVCAILRICSRTHNLLLVVQKAIVNETTDILYPLLKKNASPQRQPPRPPDTLHDFTPSSDITTIIDRPVRNKDLSGIFSSFAILTLVFAIQNSGSRISSPQQYRGVRNQRTWCAPFVLFQWDSSRSRL